VVSGKYLTPLLLKMQNYNKWLLYSSVRRLIFSGYENKKKLTKSMSDLIFIKILLFYPGKER